MEHVLGDVMATLIGRLLTGALCSERDVVDTIVFRGAIALQTKKTAGLEPKNAGLEHNIAGLEGQNAGLALNPCVSAHAKKEAAPIKTASFVNLRSDYL